jgi:hypothetical protein
VTDYWAEALKAREVDKARVASLKASREYGAARSNTVAEDDPGFLDWVDECNRLLEIANKKEDEFTAIWRKVANHLWRLGGVEDD